jgi:HEPN domain-containing protein
MSDFKQQALVLLTKAEGDFRAAACLCKDSSISVWTIGFHARQAVEKALKAVLIKHEIRYPFTHYIETLTDIMEKRDLRLPPDFSELSGLTLFGALFRYEDEGWGLPATISVDRMLAWRGRR